MSGGTDRTTRRAAAAAGARVGRPGGRRACRARRRLRRQRAPAAGDAARGRRPGAGDGALRLHRWRAADVALHRGGAPVPARRRPCITVEHESLAGTGGGYPKLIAQFASDTAPDGYETALLHGYFPTAPFVQANLPLEPLPDARQVRPGHLLRHHGRGLPCRGQAARPALAERARLRRACTSTWRRSSGRASGRRLTSWTWDDYKTMIRQLSRPAEDRWGMGPWERVAGGNSDQAFLTLLRSNGGDLLSKDGTKSLVAEAPVVRALEQLADFHLTSSAAAPYTGSPTLADVVGDFAAGRFATMLNNSTGRDQIKRGGWNPRYDILLPPKGASGRAGQLLAPLLLHHEGQPAPRRHVPVAAAPQHARGGGQGLRVGHGGPQGRLGRRRASARSPGTPPSAPWPTCRRP